VLNNKHIIQHAGYLIEEFPSWRELEKIINDNGEIDDVFVDMYKFGYQQCLDDLRISGLLGDSDYNKFEELLHV
jgi:hypothetical protein